MATRILVGDLEILGYNDNPVVSPLNVSVAVILPVIIDTLSHGYRYGSVSKQFVLAGHSLTIQANGAGDVNVLDSHHLPVVVVTSGTSKSLTAEGNEVGNRWIVQQ